MVVPIAPSMMAIRFWRSCSKGCMGVVCRRVSVGGDGLGGDREDHLQVRLPGFAAGYFRSADRKPAAGQQIADLGRRKTMVALAVASRDLVLAVLVQAKHDQP